jgi:Txe/YoeB family toxin of toxin-antitoxin system
MPKMIFNIGFLQAIKPQLKNCSTHRYIKIQPYAGLGKPEPLKHSLTGCWCRRISREHRLVYEVKDTFVSTQKSHQKIYSNPKCHQTQAFTLHLVRQHSTYYDSSPKDLILLAFGIS